MNHIFFARKVELESLSLSIIKVKNHYEGDKMKKKLFYIITFSVLIISGLLMIFDFLKIIPILENEEGLLISLILFLIVGLVIISLSINAIYQICIDSSVDIDGLARISIIGVMSSVIAASLIMFCTAGEIPQEAVPKFVAQMVCLVLALLSLLPFESRKLVFLLSAMAFITYSVLELLTKEIFIYFGPNFYIVYTFISFAVMLEGILFAFASEDKAYEAYATRREIQLRNKETEERRKKERELEDVRRKEAEERKQKEEKIKELLDNSDYDIW